MQAVSDKSQNYRQLVFDNVLGKNATIFYQLTLKFRLFPQTPGYLCTSVTCVQFT